MMDARNAIIGERVRFYRTSKSWSRQKLVEMLKIPISGAQMSKYESGLSRWPADLVIEIAGLFKLDIRMLLSKDAPTPAEKGTAEWEAEKYKNLLLSLPDDQRQLCYSTISGMTKINIQE